MDPTHALALAVPLQTSRLVLEPLVAVHADLLFLAMQDPAIYTQISSPPPRSADALRSWWASLECRLSPDGSEAWPSWAVRETADGQYIGKIDAGIDRHGCALNIGYLFFPSFWGRGYATEAVGAVTDHLLGMGVSSLRALVTRGNVASARVLERNGYRLARVLRDSETLRGVSVDEFEYIRTAGDR